MNFVTYESMMRTSAALLGEYHFEQRMYIAASTMFGKSLIPFSQVVTRLLELIPVIPFGDVKRAFLAYIDNALFDPHSPIDVTVSVEFGNRVIEQVSAFAPQKLAGIVFDSRLRDYSPAFVLELLGKMEIGVESEGEEGEAKGEEVEVLKVHQQVAMDPRNLFLKVTLH